MTEINRAGIKPGLQVLIVMKQDQRSGKLTEGIVKDILTKSPTHPHCIKVEKSKSLKVVSIVRRQQLMPTTV